MASSIFESEFYGNSWSTPEMRHVFDQRRRYQRWLDIEAALARVQGRLGVIPAAAAEEIAAKARIELIDLDFVKEELARTQHSLMPLLHGLRRICEGDAGEFIHFGPTTQDIEDTGAVLELRDAYRVILRDAREVEALLMDLAARTRDLVMAERTHGQQALPSTMGLKFAIWVGEIRRHIERFKEMRPRLFVGMLHGGVGTASALGDQAAETIRLFMEELGLGVPVACWATARDHFAEYATNTAMLTQTLGKIADEVFTLSRTEIGELAEGLPEGYIGSSTMPHKRNPEMAEMIVMLSRLTRSHAMAAMEAMNCSNARDTRSWRSDWWSLPEVSMLCSAALAMSLKLLRELEIREDRVTENLRGLNGLILSEGLMFELGKKIGKQTAHEVIRKACMEAHHQGRPIREVMLEMDEISRRLTAGEIDAVSDYGRHVGLAREFVENTVATSRAKRETDALYLE